MCGITGYFSFKAHCDTKAFYQAHKKLAHRGPDDEGFVYKNENNDIEYLIGDDTIAELQNQSFIYHKAPSLLILGHRRLSIIDLSADAHQPFSYQNLSLVYNGEIYNYIELRDILQTYGYRFTTNSDTEVFLKAYHCWGEEAFSKFNGMWAAAIYDCKKETVLLTRDRFGIKPLYYSYHDDTLIFGSEIKFVVSFLDRLQPNENMIYDYLRFSYSDHTNETFFKGVYQVEPGCYLTCAKEGVSQTRFWQIKAHKNSNIAQIEKEIKSAIALRLRSDVKVGSLLSGGIDSSTILGYIDYYRLVDRFDTYSAVFHEEQFSEKSYIDLFQVTNIALKKHFIYPDAKAIIQEIDALLYIQEEPFRSLSVYSQYKIYQYIKDKSDTVVLLNGQGADEIFTGYTEHYYYYLLQLLFQGSIKVFTLEFGALKRNKKLTNTAILKEMMRILLSFWFQRKDKYNIFNHIPKKKKRKYRLKFLLQQKLYDDLTFSALREYLRYEDKNSMACSLESRLPFLDYRLVLSAFSLQDSDKIKEGVTKYALRKAAEGKIPYQTLHRKDKMGFVSPQEIWQREIFKDAMDEVFTAIRQEGLFQFLNHEKIYRLYADYQRNVHNDWGVIWRIFLLKKWKEIWKIDG